MLSPKERAEKIRQGPRNSNRWIRKLTPEQKQERLQNALKHDKERGLSSSEEYVYLKQKETEGR